MTVWATSNTVLKDRGQPTLRSRTFAVPIQIAGLVPNTIYQFFVNNINMGWACKPFGGILGANLVSDANGKLNFRFYFDQQHITGYLTGNTNGNVKITKLTCQIQSLNGTVSSIFQLPLLLKFS